MKPASDDQHAQPQRPHGVVLALARACARRARASAGVVGAHPSPMKSRTSTSAPGRSAVSVRAAPARFCQATRNGLGSTASPPSGWISKCRWGGVGSASPVLPDVAEDRSRLDVAVVDRGRREGREVRVEELVAAVGVDPQAVAGDRERADVLDDAVGDRHHGRPEVGEEVVALVGARARGRRRRARRCVVGPPTGNTNRLDIRRFFQLGVVSRGFGVAVGVGRRGRLRRRRGGRRRLGRGRAARSPTRRPRRPSSRPGTR